MTRTKARIANAMLIAGHILLACLCLPLALFLGPPVLVSERDYD